MLINPIKYMSSIASTVHKNLKRTTLIAAVTLPTITAMQSCFPLLYNPFFCPPPPPIPVMPFAPILFTPAPYVPFPPCCDNPCNTKSFEEAAKEFSVIA